MVELRKRPAPATAPPPAKKTAAAKAKATKKDNAPKATAPPASNPAEDSSGGIPAGAGGVSNTADIQTADDANATAAKVEKDAVKGKKGGAAAAAAKKPAAAAAPPTKGDTIELDSFGGEVETNEGEKTTLAKLVAASKAGVVLFTYPKASTPGCTTQVCLFRDSYAALTATGLSIYGLSSDSPKANTTFRTKQQLPYPLLCDPAQTLIRALGFKKAPAGTTRGVFVVGKRGDVLALEAGGPAPTVEVVRKLVAGMPGAGLEQADARAAAAVASEVADTAAKMDTGSRLGPHSRSSPSTTRDVRICGWLSLRLLSKPLKRERSRRHDDSRTGRSFSTYVRGFRYGILHPILSHVFIPL
nr:peroxiredoxin dot5 [Quercus suber]